MRCAWGRVLTSTSGVWNLSCNVCHIFVTLNSCTLNEVLWSFENIFGLTKLVEGSKTRFWSTRSIWEPRSVIVPPSAWLHPCPLMSWFYVYETLHWHATGPSQSGWLVSLILQSSSVLCHIYILCVDMEAVSIFRVVVMNLLWKASWSNT